MVALTIDKGNTCCKTSVWQDGELRERVITDHLSVESVTPLIEKWNPEWCALSCVGHLDARFVESLRLMFPLKLIVVTAFVDLPFKIDYESKKTLGSDRIAAAAAAREMAGDEGCLVVDAGTAITLDVVSRKGDFKGGNISPGISLRFKSLHSFTHKLPMVTYEGELPRFGKDTETAIRSGVIYGVRDEIVESYRSAKSLYDIKEIIMTGGDADILAPLLKESEIPVRVEKNLVSKGLLVILDYNMRLR